MTAPKTCSRCGCVPERSNPLVAGVKPRICCSCWNRAVRERFAGGGR